MRNKLIYTVYFLFVSAIAFARGGGGSGNGSGVRGIAGLVTIIIFFSLLYYRTRQSKRQIRISEQRDPIWNYEKLTEYVESAFMSVQDAWMKKDLSLLEDSITESLKIDLQKKIKHLHFINETNVLEEIDIKSIKIIGCEDYIDNEKDSFTAYICGSMIDYSISGLTGNITTNSGKSREKFRDLYYFRRHFDKWLIDKIDNKVEIPTLYKAKHIIE